MITATFDFTDGWLFDGQPEPDFAIRFTHGDAARLYPNGLVFGWEAFVNEVSSASYSWPTEDTVIREISASNVFPYRLDVQSDDQVTLLVWATKDGVTSASETLFTIPRPPQPYPSWTWTDGAWTPPVPEPDDDGLYVWDEDSQTWVEFTQEGS